MKKILAIALLLVSFSFATNVDLEGKKMRSNLYALEHDDTASVTTGNSVSIYLDTATTSKGFPGDNLQGDSVCVLVYGYGDADTTQVQIKIDESPNGDVTYYNSVTDTLEFPSTSAVGGSFKCAKRPNCKYRVVITAYGTTDNSSIEGVRIWGE